MKQITVLIVDDHTLVRDGICSLLELTPDIEVVGEAENGREAITKVKELTPEVVLMDLAMPIMNGLEATQRGIVPFSFGGSGAYPGPPGKNQRRRRKGPL
jgi:chemotaxis response regulator CheB